MCGITGFTWEDKLLIQAMTSAVSHRGPDDKGYFIDKHISLGHRRLSIVDLSQRGHQPMFNEDNTIVIVFNGEIYNFPTLKVALEKNHIFKSVSDTEVILHGYEEYGAEICSKLKGMFAFALWDMKKKLLLLARDQIGEKPLYYIQEGKNLLFASEIKSILASEDVVPQIDPQSLSDYLSLRFVPDDKTIFKGIKKLLPGHYLVHQAGKITVKKYWDIPSFSSISNPDARLLDKNIEKVIQEKLMADVPIGVFLSGGLDSSTIVAYLSKKVSNLQTFSIGFKDKTDETKYAEIVSKKFGTTHHEVYSDSDASLNDLPSVVWHFDEPMADPASLPLYRLSKYVSKKVKVALSGDGGDEVFGGYTPPNVLPKIQKAFKLPHSARKSLATLIRPLSSLTTYPHKQMFQLASDLLKSKHLSEGYKKLFYLPFEPLEKEQLLVSAYKNKVKLSTVFDKLLSNEKRLYEGTYKYYLKEWLPHDLLMKTDKMGMAHGLEIRAPFLDLNLVNYSLGLPPKYKKERALFRKVVTHILPREIMKRKKQGFTLPLSRWFTRKEFLDRAKTHFEDLSKRGFFDEPHYQKIINNPQQFKNDHKLWVLLNLEIWCKLYIDRQPLKKINL
ncbi:MAG: asparagine synthase (glutamine-hydrolyzing) [Nanoarchaeota archaeon]